MRKLIKVKALADYTLDCLFEGGVQRLADIKPYMQSEVFKPLQDMAVFGQVVNRDYYVAWLNEEVDLSADTLWHIGVDADESLLSLAVHD